MANETPKTSDTEPKAESKEKKALPTGLQNLLFQVLTLVFNALIAAFKGKLAPYTEAAQRAVKAAVVKVDGGLDHLVKLVHNYEDDNPLVKQAVAEGKKALAALGVEVVDLDVLEQHIKEAIFDLASAYVPDLPAPDNAPAV